MDLVAQEKLVRQAGCLRVEERVGHYALRAVTLRDYTALQAMESPYVSAGEITEGDTLALLWFLSPAYRPPHDPLEPKARRKFLRQKFYFIAPLPPFWWRTLRALGKHEVAKARAAHEHEYLKALLHAHLAETLQDAPPVVPGREALAAPEYYCDAVAICTGLARSFGGGLEAYLDLPLKFLFQAMKANREYLEIKAGLTPVLHNPSDSISDRELEACNRQLHASGAKFHPAALQYFHQRN